MKATCINCHHTDTLRWGGTPIQVVEILARYIMVCGKCGAIQILKPNHRIALDSDLNILSAPTRVIVVKRAVEIRQALDQTINAD